MHECEFYAFGWQNVVVTIQCQIYLLAWFLLGFTFRNHHASDFFFLFHSIDNNFEWSHMDWKIKINTKGNAVIFNRNIIVSVKNVRRRKIRNIKNQTHKQTVIISRRQFTQRNGTKNNFTENKNVYALKSLRWNRR